VLAGAATGNVGITVFLAGTSYAAMTNDAGDYRFDRVPAGSGYTLVAAMDGYDSVVSAVSVEPGVEVDAGTADLSIHVVPPTTGSVSGSMFLDGMTTHAGIFVYLNGTSHIAMTNGYGDYLLEGVPPGMYVLMANKHGYFPASTQYVTITAGTTAAAVSRTLAPEAAAAPVITPGTGTYEADTTVQFSAPTPGASIWVTTDGSWPAPDSGTSFEASSIVISKDGETIVRAMCARIGMAASTTTTATLNISRPWIAYGAYGEEAGQLPIQPPHRQDGRPERYELDEFWIVRPGYGEFLLSVPYRHRLAEPDPCLRLR